MKINTNASSLAAQTAGKLADRLQAQAMSRLSSGLRINFAQDDAAGLAIGARMTTTIQTSSQLINGISNGISLSQVAEGGLDTITTLLHRMRELSVQSATGTLAESDRMALNLEFQSLNTEINSISYNTKVFDRTPLAPPKQQESSPPTTIGDTLPINQVLTANEQQFNSGLTSLGYIPKGFENVVIHLNSLSNDDDLQIFSSDGKHLLGTPILGNSDQVWTSQGINNATSANNNIMKTENAFNTNATYDNTHLPIDTSYNNDSLPIVNQYNGMTLKFSGDGHPGNAFIETATIDKVTENLVLMVIGNGIFYASGTWTEPPPLELSNAPYSQDTEIVVSAAIGKTPESVTIPGTPADTVSLGTSNSQIATILGAQSALSEVDAALQKVNSYTVNYGVLISRFTSAGDNLQELKMHSTASRSRIMDSDYAVESAKLAKQQILKSASNAMITQANSLPSSILTLLDT